MGQPRVCRHRHRLLRPGVHRSRRRRAHVGGCKSDVGGSVVDIYKYAEGELVGARQRAQPPHHGRLAGRSPMARRCRACRTSAARSATARAPHAVEHGSDLRRELPGLRARGSRDRRQGTVGGLFQKNGTHFGWVVEIDPHDPTRSRSSTPGSADSGTRTSRSAPPPNAPVIAYMGDDRTNGHVYKFVSAARYVPGRRRTKHCCRRPAVLGAVQRRWHRPLDRAGAGHRAQPVSRVAVPTVPDRRDDARRRLRHAGQHPDRRLPRQQPGRGHADGAAGRRRGPSRRTTASTSPSPRTPPREQPVHQHLRRAGPAGRRQRRRHRHDVHLAALEGRRSERRSAGRPRVRGARQPVVRQGRQHVGGHRHLVGEPEWRQRRTTRRSRTTGCFSSRRRARTRAPRSSSPRGRVSPS